MNAEGRVQIEHKSFKLVSKLLIKIIFSAFNYFDYSNNAGNNEILSNCGLKGRFYKFS